MNPYCPSARASARRPRGWTAEQVDDWGRSPRPGAGTLLDTLLTMMVGAVDVFADKPYLLIGSDVPQEFLDDPEGDGEDADAATFTGPGHIIVRTIGRAGLVRATVWEGAMPLVGEVVFDEDFDLSDGELMIGDLDQTSVLMMDLAEAGPQRVVVCVDDPGYASRVHIGFDVGDRRVALPTVAGHPLPPVLFSGDGGEGGDGEGDELSAADQFGLLLDGHDAPLARLAAAIKAIPVPGYGDTSPDLDKIVHWLRGLGGNVRYTEAQACGEQIADRMRAAADFVGATVADQLALEIATDTLERLQLR
jgi:hypothetical protein